MKKQFHIKVTGEEKLVIDLAGDESVGVYVDNPPTDYEKDKLLLPTLRIEGLRWRDEQHFHLGWLEKNINSEDEISIKLTEANEDSSPLTKEEVYIAPEKDCSFCHKKKSEVEVLVEKNYMVSICNECTELAVKAIEDYRNAT